jgi:hypothetical protein
MMGENQLLLNALVSILPSSPFCPGRLRVRQIDFQPGGVPLVHFEMDFRVARSLFSASDISFSA